jgi:hypothetical protein
MMSATVLSRRLFPMIRKALFALCAATLLTAAFAVLSEPFTAVGEELDRQTAAARLTEPNPVIQPFANFFRRLRRVSFSFLRSYGAGSSAPVLTVVTEVTNDDGGTVLPQQVVVHVRDAQGDIVGSPSPGVAAGQGYELSPGTYTVSQEPMPFGYASAITGDCAPDGTITLIPGDAATCVLQSDDIEPQVRVVKQVVNDHGGILQASNFIMYVTGPGMFAQFPGMEEGRTLGMNAGGYTIHESTVGGYTASFSANCNSSIGIGETKVCVITNNDMPSAVDISVNIVNDNGGTNVVGDISLAVTGTNPSPAMMSGSAGTQSVSIGAGPYTVSAALRGYAMLASAGCAGTMESGERRTCVITANDVQPIVTVTTNVVNDHGGTASPADFSVIASGASPVPSAFPGSSVGTTVALNAGPYVVDQAPPFGYSQQFSANCAGTAEVGDARTCVITADDIPAKLTVTKLVVNDDGGTKTAGDFALTIAGLPAESGVPVPLAAGAYRVAESPDGGYAPSYGGDCDEQGNVTLAFGASAACTITNHDIQPELTIITTVTNDSGGAKTPADFSATVTGTGVSPSGALPGSASGVRVTLAAGQFSVVPGTVVGYTSLVGAGCAGTLAVGEERTCTIAYDDAQAGAPVTRSGTFWRQYGEFTRRMFSEKLQSVIRVGEPARKNITNGERLFGLYYADAEEKTNGQDRSRVETARIKLARELVTARLNCAAFGCSDAVRMVITTADKAMSSASTRDMGRSELALNEYNRSGARRAIPPSLGGVGRASESQAERGADKRYWNDP